MLMRFLRQDNIPFYLRKFLIRVLPPQYLFIALLRLDLSEAINLITYP